MFSGDSSFRPSFTCFLQLDDMEMLEMLAGRQAKMAHQQNESAQVAHYQNGAESVAHRQNGTASGTTTVAHQQDGAVAVAHQQNGTAAVAQQQNGAVEVAHQRNGTAALAHQQNGTAVVAHQHIGAVEAAHQQNGAAAARGFQNEGPRHHLVASLTEGVADTCQISCPNFNVASERRHGLPSSSSEVLSDDRDYEEPYPSITSEEVLNAVPRAVPEDDQRRYLTFPSEAVSNDGLDNSNDDLILYTDLILLNSALKTQYVVKEKLGHGSYGQVCRCTTSDPKWGREVAVKVAKNQQIYAHQAAIEFWICRSLQRLHPRYQDHIVQILEKFEFAGHVCLVFELLSIDLCELLKSEKGLSIVLVKDLTTQMLKALTGLQEARVIHGDLKPENIVLKPARKQREIKLIDFGCSYMESIEQVYVHTPYMMTRHYRAPEVLLKQRWYFPIDMWSLGCIAAELFLGFPLFPGECEYDLLRFMIEVLNCQPPDHMIRKHHSNKENFRFFKPTSSVPIPTRGDGGKRPVFQFLQVAEIAERERTRDSENNPKVWDMSKVGKNYHGNRKELSEIIFDCPIRRQMTITEQMQEPDFRASFVHFLEGILRFDPEKRWTPSEALQHPFITGEPFTPSFEPLPDPKRFSFQPQAVPLDHNARHRHFPAASPSQQVLQPILPNAGTDPGYQAHQIPYNIPVHSGVGSNGMQVDNPALGGSPRSFGDYSAPILCRSGPYGTGPGPGADHGYNQGGIFVPHLLTPGFVGNPAIFPQGGNNVSNGSAQIEAGLVQHHVMFPHGTTHAHPHYQPTYYYASPRSSFGSGYASRHSFSRSPWANASPASTFQFSHSTEFSFSSPSSNPLSMHNSPSSRFELASLSPGNRVDHGSGAQNIPQRKHWPNGSQQLWAGNQKFTNGNEALIRGHDDSTSFPPRPRNDSNGHPAAPSYRPRSILGAFLCAGQDNLYEDHAPPPGRRDSRQGYNGAQPHQHPGAASSSSHVTAMEVNAVSNGISRLDSRGK